MILSIVFFVLYISAVVLIGAISATKESEEDFMIAERRIEGFKVAATMTAGYFDGAILSVYLAYIYQFGFSAIWIFIGLASGFLLLKRYASRIKAQADQMKVYSMPEYFYRILDKKSGLMFSLMIILQFFLLLIVNFIVAGKVLSLIFPISYWLSVIIGGSIILTYLMLAGFKAVVRTDIFQLAIMFLMVISVATFLIGKTSWPPVELDLGAMGVSNIIGFLVLGGLGIIVAPDLWQRIFATKDNRSLERGLSYSALMLPLLAILMLVVGLATKQFFPGIVPEDALISGFSELLPFGLKEFGMVLLYAVALSSSDTVTFVVSSIMTRDIKNYSRRYSEESMTKLTRFFIALFIVLAGAIAIVYQDILALGFSLASLNLALFPVVFGTFYWQLKGKAVFWSLVLALFSIVVLFLTNSLSPQTATISFPIALVSLIALQKVFR